MLGRVRRISAAAAGAGSGAAVGQHQPGGFGGIIPLGGAAGFGLAGAQDDEAGMVVIAHFGGRPGAGDDGAVGAALVEFAEAADDFGVQGFVGQFGGAVVGDLVEVFLGIEVVAAIVAPVEVVQLAVHSLDGFGVGGGAVSGHHHAQVDLAGGGAAHRLLGGAAEEYGAGGAAGGAADGTETLRPLQVNGVGAGVIAVHFAHHRAPLGPQQADEFLADGPFAEGQAAGHNHRGRVVAGAEPADGLRHHPQHAAGALELVVERPVVVEAVENFGVDGVALAQSFQVAGFAGGAGVVGGAALVHSVECLAGGFAGGIVAVFLEQAAADDGEGFVVAGLGNLGYGLGAVEDVFQHRHSFHAARAAGFGGGYGQGYDEGHIAAPVDGLGEVLEKGADGVQVGVAGVVDDFVHQDDAGAGDLEQAVQFGAAGGNALAGGGGHGVIAFGAAQLVCHFAPQGVQRVAGGGAAVVGGRKPGSLQHAHFGFGAARRVDAGVFQDAGDFGADAGAGDAGGRRIEQVAGAFQQVVQGDEAMGFAAAKAGFGLDDGVAALPVDAPGGGYQQVADAAGDVGAAEKFQRVAVHCRGGVVAHLLQVGGKVGFPKGAFNQILLGKHNFVPGMQGVGRHGAPGRRRRRGRVGWRRRRRVRAAYAGAEGAHLLRLLRAVDAGQGFADEIQAGFGLVGGGVIPAGVVGQVVADVPYHPQAVADGGGILKLAAEQVGPVAFHQVGDKPDLDGAGDAAVFFPQLVGEVLRLAVGKGAGDGLLQAGAGFLPQHAGDEFAHFGAVDIEAVLEGVPVGVLGGGWGHCRQSPGAFFRDIV